MTVQTRRKKIEWGDAVKALAPYWIDPNTIPLPKSGAHLAAKPEGKQPEAERFERLLSDMQKRKLPKVRTIVAAVSALDMDTKLIAEVMKVKHSRVLQAVQENPWSQMMPSRKQKSLRVAQKLQKLIEYRLSLKDAEAKLGRKIDRKTIPLGVFVTQIAKRVRKDRHLVQNAMLGRRKTCETCGDAHTCDECVQRDRARIQRLISWNEERVSRNDVIQAAIRAGMDETLIAILFADGNYTLIRNLKKKQPSQSEEVRGSADRVVRYTLDLYGGDPFPVIAKGKEGETRLGRATKHVTVPSRVLIVTERELEFIKLYLAEIDSKQIAEKMGIDQPDNFIAVLMRKLKLNDRSGLRSKLKAYGLKP